MKETEISYGNKIINYFDKQIGAYTNGNHYIPDYCSSYKELMPVWFKMQYYLTDNFGFKAEVGITEIAVYIKFSGFKHISFTNKGVVTIYDVWMALVDFCSYYKKTLDKT